MKRTKISYIISYFCVLCFAALGVLILAFSEKGERISNTENRMLQGFPVFSAAKVLDGSFMEEFENYMSDAFPRRDAVVSASRGIMTVFGQEDSENALKEAIEKETGGAEEETENVSGNQSLAPSWEETSHAETGGAEDAAEGTAGGKTETAVYNLIHEDGSVYTFEKYSGQHIEYVAQVLNQYRDCLPEDGTVHVINAPVSAQGNPVQRGYFSDWEYTLDDVMQPLLEEGVIIYDTFEIFRPYLKTDDLFSTEDHHWHAIGALRVANAMLSNVGYNPADFYEYDYWLGYSLKHGPYNPDQLQNMKIERENLKVLNPLAPTDAYLITKLTKRSPSLFLDFKYNAYSMYLGGPHGPYRLFETGFHTGRNALVIGDSDSYAFIPYLTPYYDSILTTDPRNANYDTAAVGASIRKYIEEYDISDVYIITCTSTEFNGPVFSYRLERFLNTDYGLG